MTNPRTLRVVRVQPDQSVDAGNSALQRGGPVDEDCLMLKMITVVTLCLAGMTMVAWPLPLFQSVDVVDAVQNVQITQQANDIRDLQQVVRAMDSKLNYMLGGVAGIYGILAIVGIINAFILKKKT